MGKGALVAAVICASMVADTSWAQVFGGGRLPATSFDRRADVARPEQIVRPFEAGPQSPPPPASNDLYLAGPDTYAPGRIRRDRRERIRGYGYGTNAYGPVWPMLSDSSSRSSFDSTEVLRDDAAPSAARPTLSTRVAEPGPPKTFFVIPRCYAGDTPPRAEQLPAGCDLKDLRMVPPNPSH